MNAVKRSHPAIAAAPTVDDRAARLAAARSHDPFGYLGARREGGHWTVRVFFPHAQAVALETAGGVAPMARIHPDGIYEWRGEPEPRLPEGALYKYELRNRDGGTILTKTDPYATSFELRPDTAARTGSPPGHAWRDEAWLARRAGWDWLHAPLAIYELHAGSWRRHPDGRRYTSGELAEHLIPYVRELGYTHIELLPVMEHPFDESWGYQTTGYFAATSRYGGNENFVLPLSHDEVVHRKGSLLDKMPGDAWQKFANLRLLLTCQMTMPGKKLSFMGNEFGQGREWNAAAELDWALLDVSWHRGVQRLTADLNHLYRSLPALHELDFEAQGFRWIDCHDADNSVVSFVRYARDGSFAVVALNFTPVPRHAYRIGMPRAGSYEEILNSDSRHYQGSDLGNYGTLTAREQSWMGFPASATLVLPPLGGVILLPR